MLGRMVFCRFLCVVGSVEMVSVSNVDPEKVDRRPRVALVIRKVHRLV